MGGLVSTLCGLLDGVFDWNSYTTLADLVQKISRRTKADDFSSGRN
jgi:hypothetical protein